MQHSIKSTKKSYGWFARATAVICSTEMKQLMWKNKLKRKMIKTEIERMKNRTIDEERAENNIAGRVRSSQRQKNVLKRIAFCLKFFSLLISFSREVKLKKKSWNQIKFEFDTLKWVIFLYNGNEKKRNCVW